MSNKYIHLFENKSAYETGRTSSYIEPWTSYTIEDNKVNYNIRYGSKEWWRGQYFSFEILGDGTVSFDKAGPYSDTVPNIQYQKNEGTWATFDANTTIPVEEGDVVKFKGVNARFWSNGNYSYKFVVSCNFNVCGNILSLIYGDDFYGSPSFSGGGFSRLFWNCTTLIDASKLQLDIMDLSGISSAYENMFEGCTNLINAPDLPATTLNTYCYDSMFKDCTSLKECPALPATNLALYCYYYMFSGCTSLTTMPELPATTLANSCYCRMFSGCTNLTNVVEVLPATTLISSCYSSMFYGCSSLTKTPRLPAPKLVSSCYFYMFRNCTSLNEVTCLATNISASSCTNSWLDGVSSTGNFIGDETMMPLYGSATTTWPIGINGVPEGWTYNGQSILA